MNNSHMAHSRPGVIAQILRSHRPARTAANMSAETAAKVLLRVVTAVSRPTSLFSARAAPTATVASTGIATALPIIALARI